MAITPEGKVQRYCAAGFKRIGGLVRKLKWEGRNGAPDLCIFMPGGIVLFIEVKKDNGKVRVTQSKEHKRMKDRNAHVYIIRTVEEANTLFAKYSLDVI